MHIHLALIGGLALAFISVVIVIQILPPRDRGDKG